MVTTDLKFFNEPPSSDQESESRQHIQELLGLIGFGKMSAVAYDTAWVARLGEIDSDLSGRALDWLAEHQLPDGSWGAEKPYYCQDRLIGTLSALIALSYRDQRAKYRSQIERGLLALETITDETATRLQSDFDGVTVGFEMIIPTLIAEAESQGLIKQRKDAILRRIQQQRQQKLARMKGKMVNRDVTLAFSSEMAGIDGQQMLDIENLQEENGSVGCSPSATAYFALQVKKGDQRALDYLHRISEETGGTPNVAPFDTFETAWTLWNINMLPVSIGSGELLVRHLNFLSQSWDRLKGAGFCSEYSVNDSDVSAMAFDTLSRYGVTKSLDVVLGYEEENWFRCYDLENDPSISANVHILNALRQAGYKRNHPSVIKILNLLQGISSSEGYWKDKWHISPYYTTAHAIIACASYANEVATDAVNWIMNTQNPDGSWGAFSSSREETAYALQALWLWDQTVQHVPKKHLRDGKKWLEDHQEHDTNSLWVGKCLYNPILVVDSAVATALNLVEG